MLEAGRHPSVGCCGRWCGTSRACHPEGPRGPWREVCVSGISSVELLDLPDNWIGGHSEGEGAMRICGLVNGCWGAVPRSWAVQRRNPCRRSLRSRTSSVRSLGPPGGDSCREGGSRGQGWDQHWREQWGPNFCIFLCHLDLLQGECISGLKTAGTW